MLTLCKQLLSAWNSDKNQRTKLQQAYIILIVLLSIAAGVFSLINNVFSRAFMLGAVVLAVVYLVNGILWALLDAFVAPIVPKNTKSDKPTRKK